MRENPPAKSGDHKRGDLSISFRQFPRFFQSVVHLNTGANEHLFCRTPPQVARQTRQANRTGQGQKKTPPPVKGSGVKVAGGGLPVILRVVLHVVFQFILANPYLETQFRVRILFTVGNARGPDRVRPL